MADNSLTHIDPRFRSFVTAILQEASRRLLPAQMRVTVTWRGSADQNAAASHGLSKAVWGNSPHNVMQGGQPAALAFDYAIIDGDGNYITDGSNPLYAVPGSIARSMGLVWGGDWTPAKDSCNPDFDHIEANDWRLASADPARPLGIISDKG